jgi:Tfp pilus assembly protein PilF
MRQRLYQGVPAVLLALLPQLGCATGRPGPAEEPFPARPAAADARAEAVLPPKQAAAACLAVARSFDQAGHAAEAIERYEYARRVDPRHADVAWRLAVLYDRQGQDDRAQAEYQAALQAHLGNAALLNDVGYFHYQRGRWAEAEKWLRRAVDKDPDFARAWVNLGLALGQQGRAADSHAAFARVLTPAEAHANVGVLLARRGRTDEARPHLQQAVALDPARKAAQVVLDRLGAPAAAPAATLAFQPVPGDRPVAPPAEWREASSPTP